MNDFSMSEWRRVERAHSSAAIPNVFCWTKFGTESGQPVGDILRRKELERAANRGVFVWGIGNSLGGTFDMVRQTEGNIEVLFSPMKSRPKSIDVRPGGLVVWLQFEGLEGQVDDLPEFSLVVSRASGSSGDAKRSHFALLCERSTPLKLENSATLDATRIRNYASLSALGASQVTALVRYLEEINTVPERKYDVAMRANLWNRGFVRLRTPVEVSSEMQADLYSAYAAQTADEWVERVARLKSKLSESAMDRGNEYMPRSRSSLNKRQPSPRP